MNIELMRAKLSCHTELDADVVDYLMSHISEEYEEWLDGLEKNCEEMPNV